MRDLRRSLLNIVNPVVVSVVDAAQMNALVATHNRLGLVEQHSYADLLHSRNHADRIVIAQYAID